ncbi:hypothetical protein SCHPADRAFT_894203 [Schizopora paradoxa]|uniref:Wbp11/ELF5/Saf1 N-terminal domain-containing protein n=1 Tax=Schizopora paradoxa TaxID=27342 RepID=A0A0H2REQ6_9AGAM|nr:hypothetical protein SCHPADRAFT_894203 [Schizopora paradoxa]
MAKGKSVNPADAFRKAQRKKELKKRTRDFALVKKDTNKIQDEITKLELVADPSAEEKARLKQLKTELADINKKKEEYVGSASRATLSMRHERRDCCDPVIVPSGMPPPDAIFRGKERQTKSIMMEQKAQSDDDDVDIAKPEVPPLGYEGRGEEADNDEDAEGPPLSEGQTQNATTLMPVLILRFLQDERLKLLLSPLIYRITAILPLPPPARGFAGISAVSPFSFNPLSDARTHVSFCTSRILPSPRTETHAALQVNLLPIPKAYQTLSGIPHRPQLPPISSSSSPHDSKLSLRRNVAAPANAQAPIPAPAAISARATISTERELRDLKESTEFASSSLMRNKARRARAHGQCIAGARWRQGREGRTGLGCNAQT